MFGSIFTKKDPLGQGREAPYHRVSLGIKPSFRSNQEPPLRELLDDHITLKLMASDRIAPEELRSLVRSAQDKLRGIYSDEQAG